MIKVSFNIMYYHKNTEREKYLQEQMDMYGIQPNWIRKYDKEMLSDSHYDKMDKNPEIITKTIEKFIPEFIIKEFIEQGMNDAEVSLNTKHVESMRTFLRDFTEKDYYVALEDDAILCKNFRNKFIGCMQAMPNDFNLFHFDWGNMTPKIDPEELEYYQDYDGKIHIHENQLPAKFMLGSAGFCMSYNWCQRVVEYYDDNGFSVPSDWQLSSIFFDDDNSKCFVPIPRLIKQGSFGVYGSSVRDRDSGVFK